MCNLKTKIMPTRKEEKGAEVKETKKAAAKPAVSGAKDANVKRKSVLQERAMKLMAQFATKMDYDPRDKISEMVERRVTRASGEKDDILFVTFSENGKDDEKPTGEIAILKDMLFVMFQITNVKETGKITCFEILPPEEEGQPYIGYFYDAN